jgi:hypothetical protein
LTGLGTVTYDYNTKLQIMITQFMINEITSLVNLTKKQNIILSEEYINALYDLEVQDIIMLKESYISETTLS